jgi:hypothetical protein
VSCFSCFFNGIQALIWIFLHPNFQTATRSLVELEFKKLSTQFGMQKRRCVKRIQRQKSTIIEVVTLPLQVNLQVNKEQLNESVIRLNESVIRPNESAKRKRNPPRLFLDLVYMLFFLCFRLESLSTMPKPSFPLLLKSNFSNSPLFLFSLYKATVT